MLPTSPHTVLFWASLLLAFPGALLAPTKRSECTNPAIRREWSTLSQSKRDAFHKAVKCLQTKPSIVESGGDLSECGYTDPMPYWDWTRNADSASAFRNAPIFDPVTGFGGPSTPEGNGTAVCVDNGPYAGFQVNIPEPHCLQRSFPVTNEMAGNWTSSTVNRIMEYPDYMRFWNTSERSPHDLIHGAVGADLRQNYSPNEPLFFLHHSQVDRLWTLWQGRNATRLSDYQGNTVQNTTDYNASLQDTMKFMGLGDDRSVESLMDTLSNGLCYKYDDDE
ncbi:tyrosinase [Rhizoctonia solani]|uniref:Tyrosinase n=1 Tax=Rhizoctonia solani TaxID=456999 RepID=A0A8H8SYG4_9AGAM|nr:tyrosinase [Rhizoctonia solani]QRW22479.1 tyrosinase [Rhizoctonia solani]